MNSPKILHHMTELNEHSTSKDMNGLTDLIA